MSRMPDNTPGYSDWMPDEYVASAVYEYTDRDGTLLFGVSRASELDENGKKVFRQWRPDPTSATGRRWSLKDDNGKQVRRVLFDLPKVIQAVAAGETVYLVEGEKDSINLQQQAKVCATTAPGGAGKWSKSYCKHLEGASVIVVCDKDAPGWAHARQVLTSLEGIAASVRVVCALEGKDSSDHLAAGHGIDDFVALDMSKPQPDWARGSSTATGPSEPPDGPKPETPDGPTVEVSREDGAAILAAVEGVWRRYVVWGSDAEPVAMTLWVMHTHAFDAADCTPYPDIGAATFESGKTRVIEVAELLVARAWRLSEPTEATLFRKIAQDRPTILVDEYDLIWGAKAEGKEGLRAVFDVGYRRGGSVPRCTGEGLNMEVTDFPVFCPKLLAGIPPLPRAIATRSIPVRLRRKKKSEHVERFRDREAKALIYPLRDRLAAWAELMTEELRDAAPALPWALSDRQQDCWEPLLAIADAAGGDWPQRARDAAHQIHVTDHEDPGTGELLLRHVADAFAAAHVAYLSTVGLLKALIERDDGPWADMWEKPLAEMPPRLKGPSMRLAKLLKPFDVVPEQIAVGAHGKIRGYRLESFDDAWERYGIILTPESPPPPAQDGSTVDPRSEPRANGRTENEPTDLKVPLTRHPTVLPTSEGGGGSATVNAGDEPPATVTDSSGCHAPSPQPGATCPECGGDWRTHHEAETASIVALKAKYPAPGPTPEVMARVNDFLHQNAKNKES